MEPGGVGEGVLEVRNTAVTPDRITVEAIGDAAAWIEIDPRALDVPGGASAIAAVRVRPPRDAGPAGATVDVAFVVRSGRHPEAAAVELAVIELRPASPAPDVAHAATSRPPPVATRALAGAGLVVLVVAVVAGAAILRGGFPVPGATPAAVTTPSAPGATPTPTRTPVPATTASHTPSPTPTPAPPTPTPGPDAPAAWWQDVWDAAALQGATLGALVAEGTTDDGLPFATFADGAVYQRVTDAFSMSGAIWRAWVERGGGAGPAPGLGFPAGPPLGPDPGNRRQLFDDGAVYWTEATGAHVVHGEVWAWWRQLVRDRGGDVERPGDSGLVEPLGSPVGDVRLGAGGTWVDLEAGRIGVRTDGTRWACSTATPPSGFLACAVVDPRP